MLMSSGLIFVLEPLAWRSAAIPGDVVPILNFRMMKELSSETVEPE